MNTERLRRGAAFGRRLARIALGVDDVARADVMLAGVVGKQLTYRTTAREA
jgi:hypothetical protein